MEPNEQNQKKMPKIERMHAIVSGSVQGVGFRYFVMGHADVLQLQGWVRNTMRGEVEVVVEGARPDLEHFLNFLKSGPRSAYVTKVDENWQSATGEFSDFQVRPTA